LKSCRKQKTFKIVTLENITRSEDGGGCKANWWARLVGWHLGFPPMLLLLLPIKLLLQPDSRNGKQ